MFVGDDVTDEDAFSRLTGPDLGIKVGQGATFASQRVDGPDDVARLLARLVESRREWLAGANAVPIERHAMLADGKTVALVTPDARITWLCHPRPDSAPLFAELVGGRAGGSLAVRPAHDGAPTAQRYLEGTLTLETRWAGLIVRDYLDRGEPVRPRAPRARARGHGRGDRRVHAAARLRPHADPPARRSATASWCSARPTRSRSTRPGSSGRSRTTACRRWRARASEGGRPYVLELRCGSDSLAPHPTPEPERRERTEQHLARLARRAAPAGARAPAGRAQRADAARRSATSRPAPSWPPPRRACPRRSAASATGTTATAGCATPR